MTWYDLYIKKAHVLKVPGQHIINWDYKDISGLAHEFGHYLDFKERDFDKTIPSILLSRDVLNEHTLSELIRDGRNRISRYRMEQRAWELGLKTLKSIGASPALLEYFEKGDRKACLRSYKTTYKSNAKLAFGNWIHPYKLKKMKIIKKKTGKSLFFYISGFNCQSSAKISEAENTYALDSEPSGVT